MSSIKEPCRKSGNKCSVETCKKSKRMCTNLKLFKFPPLDGVMGQIWQEKCGVKDCDFDKNLLICQHHFAPSDVGNKYLKPGAVPCLNLPEYKDDFNFEEPDKMDVDVCASGSCGSCEKIAKERDFYRKKYYKTLQKLKNYKSEKKNSKIRPSNILEKINSMENINRETKVFCKLLLNLKPRDYTTDTRDFAQTIYYASQSSYKFLRNKLNLKLPHVSTVYRWAAVKALEPGFQNEGLPLIEKKSMELQSHEKSNIILLLDEMAIRSEINYNSKRDMIDGFEDNGFKRSKVIAKQLCVFMLKSMFSNWSVMLNYFVSKNGLTASELQQIILENIRIVERLGMRVKIIICDQGSANRKCFSEFGVTVEKPYVLHNNEKIICIYDFPHLIKSLRNGWLKCDMETLDGRVSFRVIQELWELEEGATTKMCTKLTRRHIYPNSFEKMKVKLATQVFSHTVLQSKQ